MSKVCTKCGEEKSLDEYHINRNSKSSGLIAQCKECKNAAVRAYNKRTNYASSKKYCNTDRGREARRRINKTYRESEHGKAHNRSIKTESVEQFLKYKLANLKARGKWVIGIDVKYLLGLYNNQSGRCSISLVPMTHQYYDLRCISIDRIDSSKGYVNNNVQLVCRAINLGKQDLPNQAMIEFISEVVSYGQNLING